MLINPTGNKQEMKKFNKGRVKKKESYFSHTYADILINNKRNKSYTDTLINNKEPKSYTDNLIKNKGT